VSMVTGRLSDMEMVMVIFLVVVIVVILSAAHVPPSAPEPKLRGR